MSPAGVAAAAARSWAAHFGDLRGVRRWWVPGRIEVLGKHVDYAGGRSLLATVDRGFHVLARPRRDALVHLVDARSRDVAHLALDAALPNQPGRWVDYPISVLRRVARDFPGSTTGMDAVIASSLPSAAGLSSSSALVIASFLPLAAFNDLEAREDWRAAIRDSADLAGYLGAVENGRAFGPFGTDFGVGTQGGSEDHTAILCCREGHLSEFRFLPVRAESETPLPEEWTFVIAACGVPAPKAGSARESYNRLAEQTGALLAAWNARHDSTATSLLDVLAEHPDAEHELQRLVMAHPNAGALSRRLEQFRSECMEIIPGAVTAVARRHPGALGAVVARSHELAVTVLENQIAETIALVRLAREERAIAASPFGAGFGGSVWALVERDRADAFRDRWLARYRAAHPDRADGASAFVSRPSRGAGELG